jgi:hypothetical protein
VTQPATIQNLDGINSNAARGGEQGGLIAKNK